MLQCLLLFLEDAAQAFISSLTLQEHALVFHRFPTIVSRHKLQMVTAYKFCQAWWHVPLTPVHLGGRHGYIFVSSRPLVQRNYFQDCHGSTERLCLKSKTKVPITSNSGFFVFNWLRCKCFHWWADDMVLPKSFCKNLLKYTKVGTWSWVINAWLEI